MGRGKGLKNISYGVVILAPNGNYILMEKDLSMTQARKGAAARGALGQESPHVVRIHTTKKGRTFEHVKEGEG